MSLYIGKPFRNMPCPKYIREMDVFCCPRLILIFQSEFSILKSTLIMSHKRIEPTILHRFPIQNCRIQGAQNR